MKRTRLVTALAAALMVVGFSLAAAAQDTTPQTTPQTFGPGWRQSQMIQARNNGQQPTAIVAPRGPGMGYGMGPGAGMGRRAAVNADGTVDTTRLPAWCPYRTTAPQK